MKNYILILACISNFCSCQLEKYTDKKTLGNPNVLFIAVDDLRPMLGCYQNQYIMTPHFDKLASQGTLFERAYCNVPVCGASRASLLTGLRPTKNRFLDYNTRAEIDAPGTVSLPLLFKQNGYHTISLGKIFHFKDDMAESWTETPWRPTYVRPNNETSHSRHYLIPQNQILDSRGAGLRGPAYEMADVPDSAYFDGQTAKRAANILRQFGHSDSSFFLAVGFLKPHLPFNAPKKYWDLYPEERIELADNPYWPQEAPRQGWYGTGELRKYHGVPKHGEIPDSLAIHLVRGYRACVSYIDALIGELLDVLEETGLDQNTIVVLWGDHGYLLGEHKLWCKHVTFDKALHVPLIISAPELNQGHKINGLVEYVDVYPTLCDLAGFPKPDHLDGASLLSPIRDPESAGKAYILSRYLDMEAVKTDRFLYTEWIDSTGNAVDHMLYDHFSNPEENVNVSKLPEHSKTIETLSHILATSRQ